MTLVLKIISWKSHQKYSKPKQNRQLGLCQSESCFLLFYFLSGTHTRDSLYPFPILCIGYYFLKILSLRKCLICQCCLLFTNDSYSMDGTFCYYLSMSASLIHYDPVIILNLGKYFSMLVLTHFLRNKSVSMILKINPIFEFYSSFFFLSFFHTSQSVFPSPHVHKTILYVCFSIAALR